MPLREPPVTTDDPEVDRLAWLDWRVDGMHRILVRMVAGGVVLVIALSLALYVQGYEGRRADAQRLRQACETVSKPKDALSALGWRTAQKRALSQGQPDFAAIYAKIAARFEGPFGADRDCDRAYPKPGLLPG